MSELVKLVKQLTPQPGQLQGITLKILQSSSLPANELRVFTFASNDTCKIKNIKYSPEDSNVSSVVIDDDTKKQFLLGVVLSLIRKCVGAEKLDREGNDQSDVLVNQKIARFIIEYFSDLTLQEIEYAFDLSMMGRLNLGDQAEHYGKFSQQYVARVLTAYTVYRGKIVSRIKDMLAEYESDEDRKKKLSSVHYESISYMLKRFDAFINNNYQFKPLDLRIWYMHWRYIESNNLATVPEEIRNECRVKAKEFLIKEYESSARKVPSKEAKPIREHLAKVMKSIYNDNDALSLEKFEASLLS